MPRNRWQSVEGFEIPLTPLVDIIFILIVFFLVATTFYSEERDIDITLPEGTEGDAILEEDGVYVINVRDSGAIVVENRILSMGELEQELEQLCRGGQPRVEIRGDTDCRHGRIMGVMNVCKKHGVADYSLTQRIVKDAQ